MFDLSNLSLLLADVVWYEHYDPHTFQDLAVQALVEGHDGPALREMAWFQDDSWTREALYRAALRELGYELPTAHEAFMAVLKQCATGIVAGTQGPGDGALCLHDFAHRAYVHRLIDDADYRAFDNVLYLGYKLQDDEMNELPPEKWPPDVVAPIVAMARALLRPVPKPWFGA